MDTTTLTRPSRFAPDWFAPFNGVIRGALEGS